MILVQRIIRLYKHYDMYQRMRYPNMKDEEIYPPLSEQDEQKLSMTRLTAQDIILNPFTYSIGQADEQDILQEHTHTAHMPDEKRQRLNQFMSTPKFIKCLTEIS